MNLSPVQPWIGTVILAIERALASAIPAEPRLPDPSYEHQDFDLWRSPTGRSELFTATSALYATEAAIIRAMDLFQSGTDRAIYVTTLSPFDFASRLLARVAKLHLSKVETGLLTDADWDQITEAFGRLHDLRFDILSAPSVSMVQLLDWVATRDTRDDDSLVILLDNTLILNDRETPIALDQVSPETLLLEAKLIRFDAKLVRTQPVVPH